MSKLACRWLGHPLGEWFERQDRVHERRCPCRRYLELEIDHRPEHVPALQVLTREELADQFGGMTKVGWPTAAAYQAARAGRDAAARLRRDYGGPSPASPPSRKAIASALFARYGTVTRDTPSVKVPSGPVTGHRSYSYWLEDADEVLAYAERYPNG